MQVLQAFCPLSTKSVVPKSQWHQNYYEKLILAPSPEFLIWKVWVRSEDFFFFFVFLLFVCVLLLSHSDVQQDLEITSLDLLIKMLRFKFQAINMHFFVVTCRWCCSIPV